MGQGALPVPPGTALAFREGVIRTERSQPGVLRVSHSKAETRAFYNRISRFYDLLAERTEAPVRELGLELLAVARGEKILEVGFGTGHCLVALARAAGREGRVFGIDLSDRMLEQARGILEQEGLEDQVELVCGDAANLPYGPASMDGIFMSFVLELFDTPEIPKVLRECRRVLRPGGRIVVVGMSKDGAEGPLVRLFEWAHQHFPRFLDCRPIFVRRALESGGFTVKESVSKQMWVPVEIVLGVGSSYRPEE